MQLGELTEEDQILRASRAVLYDTVDDEDIGGSGEDLGETESIRSPYLYKRGFCFKENGGGVVIFMGAEGFGLALPASPGQVRSSTAQIPPDFFITTREWNELANEISKVVTRRVLWWLLAAFVVIPVVVFFASLICTAVYVGIHMTASPAFYFFLFLEFSAVLVFLASPIFLGLLTKPWKEALWRSLDSWLVHKGGQWEQRLKVKLYHTRIAYFPKRAARCLFWRGPAHVLVVTPMTPVTGLATVATSQSGPSLN